MPTPRVGCFRTPAHCRSRPASSMRCHRPNQVTSRAQKMSTELIRQGANMAWLEEKWNGSGHTIPGMDSGTFDKAVNNAVELGARNTDGAEAILAGKGGP